MAVEVKTMEMKQFAEILKGDERKVCFIKYDLIQLINRTVLFEFNRCLLFNHLQSSATHLTYTTMKFLSLIPDQNYQIVDVREPNELEIASIQGTFSSEQYRNQTHWEKKNTPWNLPTD